MSLPLKPNNLDKTQPLSRRVMGGGFILTGSIEMFQRTLQLVINTWRIMVAWKAKLSSMTREPDISSPKNPCHTDTYGLLGIRLDNLAALKSVLLGRKREDKQFLALYFVVTLGPAIVL
ncbi:hypothetical protein TWF569_005117 [Orbilia oligospora]|nr:hypothetical protein TWF569_005117 [Orbilia oligospora]KAF3153284.1 hypothetical protein TWF594_000306 [Orbilia oligospora]